MNYLTSTILAVALMIVSASPTKAQTAEDIRFCTLWRATAATAMRARQDNVPLEEMLAVDQNFETMFGEAHSFTTEAYLALVYEDPNMAVEAVMTFKNMHETLCLEARSFTLE